MQLSEKKRVCDYEKTVNPLYNKDCAVLMGQLVNTSLQKTMAEVGTPWIRTTDPTNYLQSHNESIWRAGAELMITGISTIKYSKGLSYLSSIHQDPLAEFQKTIEKSKYILEFGEGWDGDIAVPISTRLFFISSSCISKYIEALFVSESAIISSPTINPVSNGSLDYEWVLDNARLLINFKLEGDEITAFYYGDLYNNKLAIKGSVPIDRVYDHLMKWMLNLR